jgi:hypothetical protein
MEDITATDQLIRQISAKCRVLSLGGLAVISHGLSRNTHDADIWVEPMSSSAEWTAIIGPLIFSAPRAQPVAITVWTPIAESELECVVARDGVFRIDGLERPLDIGFLENKAQKRYLEELPVASEEQAMEMIARFLTPKVAEAAMAHPSESVRRLGLRYLRELAQDGDPFAADILKNLAP